MSITFDGNRFVAPIDASYADKLRDAYWHKASDCWFTNDIARVTPFVEHLSPELCDILLNVECSYEQSKANEPTGKYTFEVPEGAHDLFPFQQAAAEYILDHEKTLLAEEPGMGKTAIMIAAANVLRPKRILIICPAIAKYNWSDKEWPMWSTQTDLTIGVAEGRDFFPDTDVVVINYDILHDHKQRLQEVEWDLLLVDESHRINNKSSRRTVMVLGGTLKIKRALVDKYCARPTYAAADDRDIPRNHAIPAIRKKKAVFATATPMNTPKDLFTMCVECDPGGLGRDEDEFHTRYCNKHLTPFGMDISGAVNLEELGARMRAKFMVRHNPDEVLDLPPLTEELFLLPPVKIVLEQEESFVAENLSALMGLAESMGYKNVNESTSPEVFLRLIGSAIIDNVPQIGKPEFKPLFHQFSIVRKMTGIAKVPYIVDFINETSLDLTEPIVVFAYHRDVLEELRQHYPDAAVVMGGVSAKKRFNEVARFQDGETNIFLGNIDAAGEAVTLTRSRVLVVSEPDWRGTALTQAIKRIHRISQRNACTAFFLAAAKSFDALVAKKGFAKIKYIKETLDL